MDFLCCGATGTSARSKLEDSVVVTDSNTDATPTIVAARAKAPDFSVNRIYEDFMEHHDDFVRIHVHLVGIVSNESLQHSAIGKRRNCFGRPRVIDAVSDPYMIVEAISKQGAADYFPIASHRFPTIKNCQTPIWDSKCVLLVKKIALARDGIRFTLLEENAKRTDEALFTIEVSKEELPNPSPLSKSQWTRFEKTPSKADDSRIHNAALEFSLMITDASDRIVSPKDMEAIYDRQENGGYKYSQQIFLDDTEEVVGDNHAVLESWKHSESNKAVLWVLGRNDCFMHPHVARALFWSHGYDLYVLNYKMNGLCRKCGFIRDPHFNSHNHSGNFNTYIPDIEQSLKEIHSQEYEVVLGYAHSTGGPVLLNYLIENGDEHFDGFLFNSPFLDWGFVGGDLVELVLENASVLSAMGAMDTETKIGVATTPEGTTPLMYLGQEIVLSDWSARLWSLYYFVWTARPLYKVPMTVGFANGVTDVHRKMKDLRTKNRPITAKPFLCITSRGDDVLKAPETLGRADWIGPCRWEIELNDNGHDVFLSYDASDTNMAIQMCRTWMKNRNFL